MLKKFLKAQKHLTLDNDEEDEPEKHRSPTRQKKAKTRKTAQSSSRTSSGFNTNTNLFSPSNQATKKKMKNEAKRVLDQIKKKSKNALSRLNRDEEVREAEREEMLGGVYNAVERKRLEKIFEIEREKVREQRTVLENKFQQDFEKVNNLYQGVE